MVGAPLAGGLAEKFDIRKILQVGLIILDISLLLLGPTLFFGGLPNQIWIIMVSLLFLGFSAALMYVPIVPEIISAVGDEHKQTYMESLEKEGASKKDIDEKGEVYF
jgi:MFS family permease